MPTDAKPQIGREKGAYVNARKSAFVDNGKARIETYIEGSGPALVVLPSYGRDGGEDYDAFAAAIARGGFSVFSASATGHWEIDRPDDRCQHARSSGRCCRRDT